MMRTRHKAILMAGALGIALGASTIAYAQREAPPIPPGSIPNGAPKELPKSVVTPDSVIGAPRETTPSKSEPKSEPKPKPKPVARPKPAPATPKPPAAAQPSAPAPAPVAVPVTPVAPQTPPPTAKPTLPTAVTAPIEPPAAAHGREDAAYAAFQRGQYKTALTLATERAEKLDDIKAMALLGEIYASGLGVKQDDIKAADWYRRAADRGDRDAMFALGMLRIAGRAGPVNREDGAKLIAAAARLKHPMASYNLGMLYLEGQLFPRDLVRAAELFRIAADAGSPEAQYALATMYKEGRGVKQDIVESTRLLYHAAIVDNLDAVVEYGIALFNGAGVARNEEEGARFLMRAAQRGSPIAQNRIAHILAAGRGMPADPVEAIKWHLLAKEAGRGDQKLDGFMRAQSADVIAEATKAAQPSIEALRSAARDPRT
jgi:TPR repeat protein